MYQSLVTLLAVGPLVAAPGVKEKGPTTYLPTRVGDKLEYEYRVGEKVDKTYTDIVTRVEKTDTAFLVFITRDYGDGKPIVLTIAVSADGISRTAINGQMVEPVLQFKLPVKAGATWEVKSGKYVVNYTVGPEEESEVPAGKFKAVRVEQVLGDAKSVLWYAPGVGLVKEAPSSGVVVVLKSFTPGK
jgi:hypothetical protein